MLACVILVPDVVVVVVVDVVDVVVVVVDVDVGGDVAA